MKLTKLVSLMFLLMITRQSFAQVVVTPSQILQGNKVLYSYTLRNENANAITFFTLTVPTTVSDVTAPSGWTGQTTTFLSTTIVGWTENKDIYGIQHGTSLSGFAFASAYRPGDVAYSVFDTDLNEEDGTTIGPAVAPAATVPEPGIYALFGVGMLLLFAYSRLRC